MSDKALAEYIGTFVRHHRMEQNKTQEELAAKRKTPTVMFFRKKYKAKIALQNADQMQVEALKSDYNVLVWDLPGHGQNHLFLL